ncbi:MAG: TatD family hydrolase [Chitinispirillaceae bacterium]|nr:TatD family hydrolase [Chitinispirillaceae bacterium]
MDTVALEQCIQRSTLIRPVPMWIDIHAHLYEYDDHELRSLIVDAHKSDVDCIVSTAVSPATAAIVLHQAALFDEIFGAVGISPFDVINLRPSWYSELSSMLQQKKVIAVGEIGIDNSNPTYPPLDKQMPVFEKQLHLAVENDLPVIIHSRGIEYQALEICIKHGVKKALFHCYTGDKNTLEKIINVGFMISISGIVTFPKSNLHELLHAIPLNRIFIETDSPYLTPVPFRGKKNTPSMVRYVGEKIAGILNIPPELLQKQIKENFLNLFLNN